MSIGVETLPQTYVGNGVTTEFGFSFTLSDPSHLAVYLDDVLQASGYTQDSDSVTFAAPPDVDAVVKLDRITPLEQPVTTAGLRTFNLEAVGDALDRLARIDQEAAQAIADNLARSIRAPDGETLTVLAAAAARLGRMIYFDPTTGDISLKTPAEILVISGGAPNGVGLPTGGTTGQVFLKDSASDNDHSWQDGGPIPVTAEKGITARTLVKRFADFLSIEDFGAQGDLEYSGSTISDYGTDDTLAIQRAIAAACGIDSAELDYTDTETFQGIASFPTLRVLSQGRKKLYCPDGNYRITGPLTVVHGVFLEGAAPDKACIVPDYRAGGFNCFEDRTWFQMRTFPFQAMGSTAEYNANLNLRNFQIRNVDDANTPSTLDFIPHPSNSATTTVCAATAVTTTVTTDRDPIVRIGDKIRFWDPVEGEWFGGTYTVAASTASSITTVENIVESFAGMYLALGYATCNGIVANGGEASNWDNIWTRGFRRGAGKFIPFGSPAPIITNGMDNINRWGIWTEIYPTLIVRPSGDSNQTYIRSGMYRFANTTVISPKFEGNAAAADWSTWPAQAVFEVGGASSSDSSSLTVIGGSLNDSAHVRTTEDGRLLSLVEGWYTGSFPPAVRFDNFRALSYGGTFLRLRNRYTDADLTRFNRLTGPEREHSFRYGGGNGPQWIARTPMNGYAPSSVHQILDSVVDGSGARTGPVVLADRGSGELFVDPVTFSRSATTVTVTTTAAHGLSVGDYIRPDNYSDLTGSGTLAFNPAGVSPGSDSWFTGFFKLQTVPSSTTFTITVHSDTGPTAGTIELIALRLIELIGHRFDELRFQTHKTLGDPYSGSRRNFSLRDPAENLLMSGRHAAVGVLDWWVSGELWAGGTLAAPDLKIATDNVTATRKLQAPDVAGTLPACPPFADDSAATTGGLGSGDLYWNTTNQKLKQLP